MWSSFALRTRPCCALLRSAESLRSSHLVVGWFRTSRSFATTADHSTSNTNTNVSTNTKMTRLSKLVAFKAGISRREAERWIRQGDVTLAGQVLTSPQQWIDLASVSGSELKAHGKQLQSSQTFTTASNDNAAATAGNTTTTTRVWLVHKVAGELVADSDPLGRPCFMPRVLTSKHSKKGAPQQQHLKPIGRLDMNTEGLVIVTNDGQYAREMEMQDLHRTYRVRAHGRVMLDQMQRRLRNGLVAENGVRYAPMKIALDNEARRGRTSTNTWFQVTCTQGKNRQVRKVFEHLGLTVTRLIRISYGDYRLHSIPPGMTLSVPVKPIPLQRRQGPLFPPKRKKSHRGEQGSDNDKDRPLPVQWIRYS